MRYQDQSSPPLSSRQPPPPTPLNPPEKILPLQLVSPPLAITQTKAPALKSVSLGRGTKTTEHGVGAARKQSLQGRFTEVRWECINLNLFFTLLKGY